jgi:hypothetical protein
MIRVKGIIVPSNWDTEGNIVAISIATHDEQEYLIENRDEGAKLKTLLRQEVELSGVVVRSGPKKTIKVKKFVTQKRDHNPLP